MAAHNIGPFDPAKKQEPLHGWYFPQTLFTLVTLILSLLWTIYSIFVSDTYYMFVVKNAELDRVARLNTSFYEPKNLVTPRNIQNELFTKFSETIKVLQNCGQSKQTMYSFYGESGIGKTTMLREALKSLQPYPYLVIDFENGSQWSTICHQIGISTREEEVTADLFKETLKALIDKSSSTNCALIVVDNANRKPEIANEMVEIVRNIQDYKVSLLLVGSDGERPKMGKARGWIMFEELSEPSIEFGVNYLKGLNITDPSLVSNILEISGTNMHYLQLIDLMVFQGKIDLETLKMLIHNHIYDYIVELPTNIMPVILNIAKTLIKEPQRKLYKENLPDEFSHNILNSNIIRMTRRGELDFQNKATRIFFESEIDSLLSSINQTKLSL